MKCYKCGATLVPGQIICSNCNTYNSHKNQTRSQNSNKAHNTNNENINYENFDFEDMDYEDMNYEDNMNVNKKQNIFLKIASIIALIAGLAMLISQIGTLSVKISLGYFDPTLILNVLISILLIFYAFFISNYNLGKIKLYDNNSLFIIFLIINLLFAFLYGIYFIIFILSLIGYIMSMKNNQ